MSVLFDGAGDSLTGTLSTALASLGTTIGIFFKVTTHPTAIDRYVMLGNNSSDNNDSLSVACAAADDNWQCTAINAAGSGGSAIHGPANFDGVWTGLVGKFTSITSRRVWVGAIANTNADAASRTIADTLQYLKLGESLDGGNDATVRLAELAIWNDPVGGPLSDAEVTSYLAGTRATGIDAANLRVYCSLTSDLNNTGLDALSGLSANGNAAIDADHPIITGGGMVSLFHGKLGGLFNGKLG